MRKEKKIKRNFFKNLKHKNIKEFLFSASCCFLVWVKVKEKLFDNNNNNAEQKDKSNPIYLCCVTWNEEHKNIMWSSTYINKLYTYIWFQHITITPHTPSEKAINFEMEFCCCCYSSINLWNHQHQQHHQHHSQTTEYVKKECNIIKIQPSKAKRKYFRFFHIFLKHTKKT